MCTNTFLKLWTFIIWIRIHNMWPDLTKAVPHTQWQGWLFTTTRFLHQWTNNPCVYHCQWFSGLLFLGLVSWACLTCSSAQVVFKWQWYDWTSTYLVGNRHMTSQKAWSSNWLLLVISRAQMGLRWDHPAVFNFYTWKNLLLRGSPPPPTSTHMWSFVIVV